jgi:2-keto-3-deoxy-L-rhamnonate aldolase RhmA
MRANHTKDKLAQGRTVFGSALQFFRSIEVPRLFAAGGFDYIFIDNEHSGLDLETVQDVIVTSVTAGITPIVRVSELLYSLVTRALDVGAQGIILPRVEDPEILRQAISWMRYPPQGTRGFGIAVPMVDYEPRSFPEIMDHLNANTLVVVQFETRLAIDRCDELLSIPGVDVAMIGPADLSISLGIPGQVEHPEFIAVVRRFVTACQKHGVVPGIQCRSLAQAQFWTREGFRFVGVGAEYSLLLEKVRETVAALKTQT